MIRELFGGAIIAELSDDYLDVSTLRQVPDTQEVFVSKLDESSLILEVLERVTDEGSGDNDWNALRFHFQSLAHDNDALSHNIVSIKPAEGSSAIPPPKTLPRPLILQGQQKVSKFNKSAEEADQVTMFMALWRLNTGSKGIDLVLCANVPREHAGKPIRGSEELQVRVQEVFQQWIKTLVIKDWSLFA